MPALIMWPMAVQLRRKGHDCRLFDYPTLRENLSENANRLDQYIHSLAADELHFVAHSLGGLLLRALFNEYPQQPPGRIVMLGTPSSGSVVAGRLRMFGYPGQLLTGRSMNQYLEEGDQWSPVRRDLGIIAGSRAFGAGTFLGGLSGPGDGTVLIEETRCPDMTDHIVLPLTHTALVAAPSAVRAASGFLAHGRFSR